MCGGLEESQYIQRMKYVCLDSSADDIECEILGDGYNVKMLGASATSPPSEADFCDADVVAVWHTIRVDEALLLKMPNARAIVRWVIAPDACAPFRVYLRHAVLIGRMGVGYDNVDTSAASTSNLLLTTGGCSCPPLTTHHPPPRSTRHSRVQHSGLWH